MPAPNPHARLISESAAEVQKIYADLANRPLERNCSLRTQCCQFHISGKIPHLTRGEAFVAAQALRATGRKTLPTRNDGACPLLDPRNARCLVYAARPFGCRTHFCAPAGGPYSRNQVLDLIHRLEEIDFRLHGDGPHPLDKAVKHALASL